MYQVRYMEKQATRKIFSTEEAAKKFSYELQAVNPSYMIVEELTITPMVTPDQFSVPQHHEVNIKINDANHMLRTIKFMRDNQLEKEFGETLINLLALLCSTRGKKHVGELEESANAQIYPDGYLDPGFGWEGCGMHGGMIFHSSSMDWSIHT